MTEPDWAPCFRRRSQSGLDARERPRSSVGIERRGGSHSARSRPGLRCAASSPTPRQGGCSKAHAFTCLYTRRSSSSRQPVAPGYTTRISWQEWLGLQTTRGTSRACSRTPRGRMATPLESAASSCSFSVPGLAINRASRSRSIAGPAHGSRRDRPLAPFGAVYPPRSPMCSIVRLVTSAAHDVSLSRPAPCLRSRLRRGGADESTRSTPRHRSKPLLECSSLGAGRRRGLRSGRRDLLAFRLSLRYFAHVHGVPQVW